MKLKHRLNLLIYPFFQVIFLGLALALVNHNFVLALISIVIAAIWMNFSLHISYHYHVHHKPNNTMLNYLVDYIITGLLGLPYHFYQWQHLNHHFHNNEIGDMTSTYRLVDGMTVAKPFGNYFLLWFIGSGDIKKFKSQSLLDGDLKQSDLKKMKGEGLLNMVLIILLFVLNWKYGIIFGLMIYIGWALIALHNYGQHLPKEKHQLAYSYYGSFYNKLFLNNGLHYEHHRYPGMNYWDLKKEQLMERTNHFNHLLDGFRYRLTKKTIKN